MSPAPLIDALREPDAYPHPCTAIRLIETHISWVFLTGEYAYKLKKPLDFGFLDFTTLARREFYCREELRCNRRFAPDLYLDCVPVNRAADGRVRIGGSGETIEWAVKMREFDVDEQADHVLERGELEAPLLRRFAARLTRIYAAAPAPRAMADELGAAHIAAPVTDNFRELERLRSDPDERAALARIRTWSANRHALLRDVFDARARDGYVRECHGDLHLANLVRRGDDIIAFDCIEFSEALRTIDPVCDIAFLFMDCAVRGRDDLAYAFLDAYLDASADYDGAALLRYYAVYRSLVRAKIAALRLEQCADPHSAESLATHLAWADRATEARGVALVLMCGVSGSGKSWLAERLAPALPAIRLRSDVARDALSPPAGESGARYSPAQRERVYTRLGDCARPILAGGDTVIVDATFADRATRARFAGLARAAGAACVVVYCTAARATLEERITRREREGRDPSEATVAVLQQQLAHFEPPPRDACVEVVTDAPCDIGEVARAIAAHII
tara:strand:+ start:6017 stop:7540 length:1524 start_codon:yes stop_codon:yes gene_type:complete